MLEYISLNNILCNFSIFFVRLDSRAKKPCPATSCGPCKYLICKLVYHIHQRIWQSFNDIKFCFVKKAYVQQGGEKLIKSKFRQDGFNELFWYARWLNRVNRLTRLKIFYNETSKSSEHYSAQMQVVTRAKNSIFVIRRGRCKSCDLMLWLSTKRSNGHSNCAIFCLSWVRSLHCPS